MNSVLNLSDSENSIINLKNISTALGSLGDLAYSPPHDYPMSVPAFIKQAQVERFRPPTDYLRLYVHIPFCNYACNFCFFAKKVGQNRQQMEQYVKALKKELEWVKPGTILKQLFMGGGTPTVLPADLLDELLTGIFERMVSEKGQVHTVETSPDSITPEHIAVLQKHNIGRVSMGIQSLDQEVLNRVNREHSVKEALAACELLVNSGFIVNVDLMYGLPGQTYEVFRDDIQTLTEKGIKAFTLYNLRLNERTSVDKVLKQDEHWTLERLMNWRAFVKKTAEEMGLTQTRWHTFKRLDSIASRHERQPCFTYDGMGYQLGIGASARSQLGYTLYRNHFDTNTYIEQIENNESPVEDIIPLSVEDRKTQFIARSLGDGKPLQRSHYLQAFDCSIDENFGEVINRLSANRLINDEPNQISLTDTGKLVYDLINACFYPQKAIDWLKTKKQKV